jgi:hypothetical protein
LLKGNTATVNNETTMRTDDRLALARPLMMGTLLLACVGACATEPPVSRPLPPPPPPEPLAPSALALEAGAGWRRVKVTGNAEDFATATVQALSDELYVIEGRAAINKTPLPANTRAVLSGKLATLPVPAGGDDEIIVVPRALNDSVQSNVAAFNLCDDASHQTFSKTYPLDKTFSHRRAGERGAAGDVRTQLEGSVTGVVKYSVRYHTCVPIFILHGVAVRSHADVVASAPLVAQFEKTSSWETQVAAPVLGTVSFFGVPVTFKAPISVGVDARAAASPAFSAGEMVELVPWAQGAVRAYVLDQDIVHAPVGARARLGGEAWISGNAS